MLPDRTNTQKKCWQYVRQLVQKRCKCLNKCAAYFQQRNILAKELLVGHPYQMRISSNDIKSQIHANIHEIIFKHDKLCNEYQKF